MSVEAITWALKCPIKQSSMKFVLVVFANCADAVSCEAFPSVKYLEESTGQDRKTVLANIHRLIALGYLIDTGYRRGATKQVIVYKLEMNPKSTENGTVPKTEDNSTVFPVEQSQNSVVTVPKTGHGTVKDTKEEPSRKKPSRAIAQGSEYSPTFEEAWRCYPKRPGANKPESYGAWKARMKQGFDETEMLAGVLAYAAYVDYKETDPNYIKQPKTFFGPGLHFRSDWSVPAGPKPGKKETFAEHNARTMAEYRKRHGIESNDDDDDGMTIDMVH